MKYYFDVSIETSVISPILDESVLKHRFEVLKLNLWIGGLIHQNMAKHYFNVLKRIIRRNLDLKITYFVQFTDEADKLSIFDVSIG